MTGWIEPPEGGTFLSLQAAVQHIETHAFDQGYALTRCDTRLDKTAARKPWR